MKKTNNYHFSLLQLTIVVLFCASCFKMDIPKDTDTEKPSPTLFTDGTTIPSSFKWSSVKTIDFMVTVDDKFDGKYFYRVELFDNDPRLGIKATLLGSGMAKRGQNYTGKIVMPALLEYVYLRRTSPVGIASVTMVKVSGPSVIVSQSLTNDENMRATAGELSAARVASTSSVVVPADAIPISGNITVVVESNKSYVVKSGVTFTGQINANNGTNGAKIYIEGAWVNRGYTFQLGGNNALYTTTVGRLELNNVIQNTEGGFSNYGTATLVDLSTSNAALYVNYGTLNADKATFSNGSFTNFGTAKFETLISTTASTKIRNEGSLTVTTTDITNATLEAACYTNIGKLTTNSAIVNVTDKALLTIGALNAGGTRFNLVSAAILEVTGTAKFNSNRNYMAGTGTSRSVARMKKVDVQNQWQAITYSGNLEVACSDHTANEQWSTFYIIESPATLVAYDKSSVVIASTNCNAGGNKDAGAGTTPTDQTVTETNLGTFSYAFEDNWPEIGDYDMNDVVVDMNIVKFQNSANKVTKVALKGKLLSVGASKRNAVAVQLDGISAGSVKSVTYSRSNLVGSVLKLGSNGVESGQTNAVVTIVDDAHKAFGVSDTPFISTQDGKYNPVEVVVTIEFTTPLDNFSSQNLDMFIINSAEGTNGRSEVHLVGYKGTDKIDKKLIESVTGTKLSTADPFKSTYNEPWALSIPVTFIYPLESKNIKDVYPKFASWAVSGGTKDTNWYLERK